MNYLLDTNVISEALRAKPSRNVLRWLETIPEDRFYLSVLTLGELRRGVEGLPVSARRERIAEWLERDLVHRFEGRVLDIDANVADVWGRMLAARKRPASAVDSLIAATAVSKELVVLTRNVAHFDFEGLRAVDPWVTRAT